MKQRERTAYSKICLAVFAIVLSIMIVFSITTTALPVTTASAADYKREELYKSGYKISTELEREGAVLFQNDNNALPLAKGTGVDLFGYMSYNIIQGGGGSGKGKYDEECLQQKQTFELAGLDVNDALWTWMGSSNGANLKQESWVADSGGTYVNSKYQGIPEVLVSTYTSRNAPVDPANNVAIATFGRQGYEGAELPLSMSGKYMDAGMTRLASADRSYLDPVETELELLAYIKSLGYSKIIVLINSSNVMTVGEYLEYSDACLWIGGPGEAGLVGVGEVLVGEDSTGRKFSPSGRTADTWMTDFYSYSVFYNNGGEAKYENFTAGNWGQGAVYNQYEEGIFMGYKWYETAYADRLVLEGTNPLKTGDAKKYDYYNDYDDIVAMPFGGGLSYTDFEWEVVDQDINLVAGGHNSITVKVTNVGNYPGKDTVQIYMNAPYTAEGIDKAEVSLIGFAKTGRLKAGGSGTVKIEFETDNILSYDYRGIKNDQSSSKTDNNGNAKWGGWVLEAGNYEFRVQKNAHTQMTDPVTATVGSDIIYNETTGIMRKGDKDYAYNKMNDVNAGDGSGTMTWMRRSTLAADWVSITNNGTGRQDQQGVSLAKSTNLGTVQAAAINTAQQGRYTATLPAPYKNTTKNITMLYSYQGSTEFVGNTSNYWGKDNNNDEYKNAVANVGLSTTSYTKTSFDWSTIPWDDSRWDDWVDQATWANIVTFQGRSWNSAYTNLGISSISASDGPGEAGTGGKIGNTWWPSEVVMACTWNPELIERVGIEYGKQCVRTGITSCYGPAMNTHRSPFGGRNFEYYSEDGFLAGTMCIAETAGIQSEGVGTFNKHFMLNDLDGGRSGQIVWCNEQALREIYIRAWEFSIKSDKAMMSGMMASLNRIGITWANRGVYTGIVRQEYDWHGLFISDGMDGVNYSGATKAAFSGVTCLLYSSYVTSASETANDGYIFASGSSNTSLGAIQDYYGAYQLRETMKQRLWYDTHILYSGPVFTMDYFVDLNPSNYEEMNVSNLDGQVDDVRDPDDETGCGSIIQGQTVVFVLLLIGVAVIITIAGVRKKQSGKKN